MFLICTKCKAGASADLGEETLTAIGFIDGKHSCGGETKIIQDHAAGVGPEMNNPNEGVIFEDKPKFLTAVDIDAVRKKTREEIVDLIKRMRDMDPESMGETLGLPTDVNDVLNACRDETLASFLAAFMCRWSCEHPTVTIIKDLVDRIKGDE